MNDYLKFLKSNIAIIGAIGTAIFYFLDYTFEVDQCRYFRIPEVFVEIDLQSFLYFASKISVLIILFSFEIGITLFINEKLHYDKAHLIFSLTFIASTILTYSGKLLHAEVWGNEALLWISQTIWFLIQGSIFVMLFLMKGERRSSILSAMKKVDKRKSNTDSTTISPFRFSTINFAFIVVTVIVLSFVFIKEFAKFSASDMVEFNTVNRGKNEFAVIKRYNQRLVCKQFDPTTHYFLDSILIINIAQNLNLSMSNETKVTFKKPHE